MCRLGRGPFYTLNAGFASPDGVASCWCYAPPDAQAQQDRGIAAVNSKLGALPRTRFLAEPDDGNFVAKNNTQQLVLTHDWNAGWSSRAVVPYRTTDLRGLASNLRTPPDAAGMSPCCTPSPACGRTARATSCARKRLPAPVAKALSATGQPARRAALSSNADRWRRGHHHQPRATARCGRIMRGRWC